MGRKTLFVVVVGVMLSCSALVSAVGVQVKFVSVNPDDNVDLSHSLVGTARFSAGLYKIDVDLDDGEGVKRYDAFCIDIVQTVSASFKPYNLSIVEAAPLDGGTVYSPMGAAKANAIRELWGEHFAQIAGDGTKAAAFQLALWEIIYENAPNELANAWNAGTGRLAAVGDTEAAIINQANAWLGTIGDSSQTLNTTLMALTNYTSETRYQDYLIDHEGGGYIPEPVTVASVLLGICGLGSYVRRRVAA